MTREEAISYFHKFMDNEPILIPKLEKAMQVAIKALEQEPILDKIRAEIAKLSHYYPMGHDYQIAITRCIAVLDKYKAESEGTE